MVDRLRARLFRPIDIASLVVFRVLFGVLMAQDAGRYIANGWVRSHYLDPPLLLRYFGFEWVRVLPAPLLYAVFGLMIAAGIAIALGWYYRIATALYLVTHGYVFLLSAAQYLNHAYLLCVVSFVLMFVPAERALSIDAWRRPETHLRRIHAWPVVALVGLLVLVYLFGGIAKLNADWLSGVPARQWLQQSAREVPFGGELVASEAFLWMVVYGGTAYDLLIPFVLLWRRTRAIGVVATLGFHFVNSQIFNIGVFPWFMLAATTLFFEPSWPRRWLGFISDRLVGWLDGPSRHGSSDGEPGEPTPGARRRVELGLAAFFAVQLFLPLRHHLYPGDVAWTEEGHYLSWRMKLRDKGGRATFRVTEPATGESWRVDPKDQLPSRETRKLVSKPDLILQYAHYLRDGYRAQGREVEVRADVFVSLNYRPEQRFVDPEIDLAKVEPSIFPYTWLLPMAEAPPPAVARTPASQVE